MNVDDWGVKLVLDNEERIWALTGKGPAHMLVTYLTEIENNVVAKLQMESEFDDIVEANA